MGTVKRNEMDILELKTEIKNSMGLREDFKQHNELEIDK